MHLMHVSSFKDAASESLALALSQPVKANTGRDAKEHNAREVKFWIGYPAGYTATQHPTVGWGKVATDECIALLRRPRILEGRIARGVIVVVAVEMRE